MQSTSGSEAPAAICAARPRPWTSPPRASRTFPRGTMTGPPPTRPQARPGPLACIRVGQLLVEIMQVTRLVLQSSSLVMRLQLLQIAMLSPAQPSPPRVPDTGCVHGTITDSTWAASPHQLSWTRSARSISSICRASSGCSRGQPASDAGAHCKKLRDRQRLGRRVGSTAVHGTAV